jgi:fibronectin type 3 domain-containing protein
MEGQVVQVMQNKPVFNKRLAIITAVLVGLAGVITLILTHAGTAPRAFSASSEWNNPLPTNAPISSSSASIISELKSFPAGDSAPNLVINPGYSNPIYYPSTTDKAYAVKGASLPPELASLRIPKGATPATGSDGEMMVWDNNKGYVVGLHHAVYSSGTDTWSADGADVYYTASNGLNGSLPESNDKRNVGHRGYPSAIAQIRYDEMQAGSINHVLKVALDETGECFYYPGSGNESGKGGHICEGQILRIKPSINLSSLGLSQGALIVATAMQKYGVVVGDTGGNNMALKTENISVTHPGASWSSVGLASNSLSAIKWDDFEAIAPNYHRPVSSTSDTTPPPVPSGFSATAGDATVGLKWTASAASDLGGYVVQYKPTTVSTWTTTPLINSSATSYQVNNLTNAQTYDFQVRAVDTSGNYSAWSANVTATPTGISPPPSDTQAPTVKVSSPVAGAVLSNIVTLSAAGSDNVGVSKVEFYQSGKNTPIGTATTPTSGTAANGVWQVKWDTTLAANGSYTVLAKAYDAAGNGPGVSPAVSVTVSNVTQPPTNNPPAVPTNVKATPQNSQVVVSWSPNQEPENDLSGYAVEWKLSGATTWSSPAQVPASQTSQTVSGLVDGLPYDFKVRASDTAGNVSAWSATASATPVALQSGDKTAPSPPKTMTATAKSPHEVDLAWATALDNAGGSGVVKYKLFRHDPGDLKRHLLAEIQAPATSFKDLTVAPSTKYAYAVDAVDAAGNIGTDSPRPSVTTPAVTVTPPTAPSTLTATGSVSPLQVSLKWTASTSTAGIDHYNLYRTSSDSVGAPTSPLVIVSVNALSYVDTRVSAGTTYQYYVRAVDVTGQSGPSSPVASVTLGQLTLDTTAPSAPTGLEASLGGLQIGTVQINLTWQASTDNTGGTGVKGYQIYRDGVKVGTSTGTSYGDVVSSLATKHTYAVKAFDGASPANVSVASNVITVILLSIQ